MHTIKLITTNKIFLEVTCVILFIGFLLAGLWPFNFYPENKVKWLADDNGISFYEQGIIYSDRPYNSLLQTKSITIEIWLQPMRECKCGLNRILSSYDTNQNENFFIAQWKTNLILGISNPISENYPPLKQKGIQDILLKGKKLFLTITSGDGGTKIYINGNLKKSYPKFSLLENTKFSPFYMLMGNSPTGKYHWTGNIYGMAIYNNTLIEDEVGKDYFFWIKNDALSMLKNKGLVSLYLFNEQGSALIKNLSNKGPAFIIPPTFRILKKTILNAPWKDCGAMICHINDILLNIIGFIPFGFFFYAYLWKARYLSSRSSLLITILTGFGISLTIELLQVYLPTRSSSLTDLICNLSGTAIGSLILHHYLPEN